MTYKANEFRGFGLFNDVEDKNLQIFNRARIMVNIMEDNSATDSSGKVGVSLKGAALVAGYFNHVPEDDRQEVRDEVERILIQRGKLNGR